MTKPQKNKISNELLDILKKLDWNCKSIGENQFEIERWATNGKDINHDITALNDFDFFVEVDTIYKNFDVDDEAKINLECPGAPSVRQILEDCEEEDYELKKLRDSIYDLLFKHGELN